MKDLDKLRVAIVYDWIDKWGGVERVLLNLADLFPNADFYTSYFDPENAPWAKNLKIKTSFIQKLPSFIKKSRILSLLLYPYAFESFDFKNYDLVISVSSSFAKSVITRPETLHICYLLTPTRYFWQPEDYLTGTFKRFGYLLLPHLKKWDVIAAQRPDYILSISEVVRKRCNKYYLRDSEVICPPFDIDYWNKFKSEIRNTKSERTSDVQTNSKFKIPNSEFFLLVSRLEPYKKVELAIETFNKLGENLVVVGKGSQLPRLKRISGKNIHFMFDLTDEELANLYQKAKALIMPQEEEFGYVALESQFFGGPVIAYGRGGAAETVLENKTGVFFEQQSISSFSQAIERFKSIEYNLKASTRVLGLESVIRFNKKKFEEEFINYLISKLKS